MTAAELAIWGEAFKVKLAETDTILAEREAECRRIVAGWGGPSWPR